MGKQVEPISAIDTERERRVEEMFFLEATSLALLVGDDHLTQSSC